MSTYGNITMLIKRRDLEKVLVSHIKSLVFPQVL
jgi:hypothetical protein